MTEKREEGEGEGEGTNAILVIEAETCEARGALLR